jgi:aminoglycoside/choline kinase family phosphotransferase
MIVESTTQADIVNWYLDKNIDTIQTTEQARQLSMIVHGVIQRMIAHEKIVIVVRDAKDYKDRLLQIHPNLSEA